MIANGRFVWLLWLGVTVAAGLGGDAYAGGVRAGKGADRAGLAPAPAERPPVPPHANWTNSLRPQGASGPELALASGGQSLYAIVTPAQPTSQEDKAAEELARWLGQMAGCAFPVLSEDKASPPPARSISVGATDLLKRSGLPDAGAGLGDEGYAIAVQGETLYLWGGKRRGPIYAIYALLEEDLGCRWYARGTATIPSLPELKSRPVPRRFIPRLRLRDPFVWDAFEGEWSLRNRTNAPNAEIPEEWGGNDSYMRRWWCHTFDRLVPPDKYFDSHPEYFALIDGKRSALQLCPMNPESRNIAIATALEALKSRGDSRLMDVSQNDNRKYCQCPACEALNQAEGTPMAAQLDFVNAVAEAVAKECPEVTITTLAYLNTLAPPKTIRPRGNVVIRLCTDSHAWKDPCLFVTETDTFQTAMKGWAAAGVRLYIWDYVTNFKDFLSPRANMPVVAPDIRFHLDHNATSVMLQGAFQSPGSDRGPLRAWVWAKQLWDPGRDTQELIKDFTYGYYGVAAEPLQQYNELLWTAWEQWHENTTREGAEPELDRAFGEGASKLMDQAERLGESEELRRRVELATLPVLVLQARRASNDFRRDGKPEDKERCLSLLGRFDLIASREKITKMAEADGATVSEWSNRQRANLAPEAGKPGDRAANDP